MPSPLYLLPGWGVSPTLLAPLAEALAPAFAVEVLALPPHKDPAAALAWLGAQVPPGAWLGGWSLGGMLAVALAALRGEGCPGVFSLASNACFSTRAGWGTALLASTFAAFVEGCQGAPAATAKRFHLLCSQGSAQARELGRRLASAPVDAPAAQLALLDALDNRTALAHYAGPQLHMFGGRDALVPAAAQAAVAALAPNASNLLLADACHAFPVETPQVCAALVLDWKHRYG